MKNPFLHPSGRAKFLENSLLPKSKFEQMVLAKDAEAALDILKDTHYGQIVHSKAAGDYKQIYAAAINSAFAEIKSIYAPLLPFFKLEYDLFNLKLIFKNKFDMVSFEAAKALFSEFGSFGIAAFEAALRLEIRELGKAFPKFEPVFSELLSISRDRKDAYVIEAVLERQMLENLYKNAPEILKPGIRIRIDLANLRILARMPKQANGAKLISTAAISSGTVSREEIIGLYGKGNEAVALALKNRIPSAAKFPDMEKIEIEMENRYLREVRRTSSDVFGAGPAISYFISRLNEARNIRAVLLGKQSNLEPEKIRALLRFAD